jgi:hypothetical protein
MKTLTLIEAATVVLGTALLGPATTERLSQRVKAQERTTASRAVASDVVTRRLSAQERAELRRQLAEYSRPGSTVLTSCKPSDTCPSSD